MPDVAGEQRPRRFATACDICSRRKVKCDGSHPCRNCAQRQSQCTYTRAAPDPNKPRRAARQLKVVTERLRQVEDELAQARSEPAIPSSDEQVVNEAIRPDEPVSLTRSGTDVLEHPVPQEVLTRLSLYYEQYNHFFPFFDKMQLINWIVQPASRPESASPALRVCVHSMMSTASRMAAFVNPSDAADAHSRAEEHLTAALRDEHHLMSTTPSLLNIRALICMVISMRYSSCCTALQAGVVLAAACRGAQFLRLHHRAEESPGELMNHCIFSTLYILDQDLAMQTQTAPILQDEDDNWNERVLRLSDLGTISNLKGDFNVGIFVASIKLAVIQNRLWMRLLSPRAKTAGAEIRLTAMDDIRAMLTTWTRTYLPPRQMLTVSQWPVTGYVHVVKMALSYFLTVRLLFPDTFSDAEAIGERLKALPDDDTQSVILIRGNISIPVELVDASLHVHDALQSVGQAESWRSLEAWQYLIAALVVLYQAAITTRCKVTARDHVERADKLLHDLQWPSTTSAMRLPVPLEVLNTLRRLAQTAVKLYPQE